MTPQEFRLLILSETATKFVERQGVPVPTFIGLPNWPDDTAFPVQRIPEDELRLRLLPDPLNRAVALRQKFDPDELSWWTFVPIRDLNQVWLVRVAKIDPSLN
jgi:hypothetical protein